MIVPSPILSISVLSAAVSRPARDVVAAGIVASVPVLLVTSSVVAFRLATARFASAIDGPLS